MEKLKLGLALTGSYCTYDKAMAAALRLCQIYDVMPIMSENSAATDSRFGRAADFIAHLEKITGKPVIRTIAEAEPIGPRRLLDVLVIAPCTGNPLAKLAHGVTDSCVAMAAKAHLRNGRPVVVAVSTNDGLSTGAANLGALMARKNIYLVPFGQDDPDKKPTSLVADFDRIEDTVAAALEGRQIQPLLL
jgi:dipicolinate synthase subunit B